MKLLLTEVVGSGRSQQIRILVDVVELFDLVFCFVFVRVEGSYVFD